MGDAWSLPEPATTAEPVLELRPEGFNCPTANGRASLSHRLIVQMVAMLEAMQAGTGSLSTTHAESAESAISRLVTCAMKAGAHVTHDYAVRAIASALNIIVHVDVRTELCLLYTSPSPRDRTRS